MTAPLKRVALYARVSSTDHGQRPDLQLEPLRAWAEAQGADRITEFVDEASASNLRGRKQWRRLLDECRAGRINIVAVWKIDRAWRGVLEGLTTIEEWRGLGVEFVAITQGIDTTTPMGKAAFAMMMVWAELERDQLRERVRAGLVTARKRGSKLGRPGAVGTPAFDQQWPAVRAAVLAGTISRRAAATKLKIGPTTLDRLLAA